MVRRTSTTGIVRAPRTDVGAADVRGAPASSAPTASSSAAATFSSSPSTSSAAPAISSSPARSAAPWTSRLVPRGIDQGRASAVAVVAHRGTARAPENTLAAMRLALQDGATMIECDVQLSKDGVPVLLHDDTLGRTTGQPGAVADYTVDELQRFDAGAWKGDAWRGEPIPTLADVLALVAGRAQLAIELKTDGMERAVVDVVQRSGVAPAGVAIYAWDLASLRAVDPRLPRTLLVDHVPQDGAAQTTLARAAADAGVQALGVRNAPHVDAAFCARAHDAGVALFVWTVNDPGELVRLSRAGVDGVISDDPAAAMHALGASGPFRPL